MPVRELVNLVYKEWPSEIERKKKYYSDKNIVKSKEDIDEQIRVDLAQVMLDRTLKNPYGRKEFITKDGAYYELNDIGKKTAESLIDNKSIKDVPNKILTRSEFIKKSEQINIPAVRNPFGGESKESGDLFNSSALFVVGESGSGKSTRILKVLRQNGHKIILIGAESASSPNLLFDYNQSEGYIPSDIGEFIISSKKDPKNFYTIVFDECHEYIDEIKRSILHAISTKRGEKRFFGVKKSDRHFFEDLETYETTSKIVPDNVGFIFISSKPDVFEYHADFMGRVDKVEVKREDPYPYPDLKYIQSKIDRQDQL